MVVILDYTDMEAILPNRVLLVDTEDSTNKVYEAISKYKEEHEDDEWTEFGILESLGYQVTVHKEFLYSDPCEGISKE